MLIVGIVLGWSGFTCWGICWLPKLWYLVGYFFVASPLIDQAWHLWKSERSVFNELTLMIIATLGAFYIGEYPEALILMILYSLGEILQQRAVDKARANIHNLIDLRPDSVHVVRGGLTVKVPPSEVKVGESISIRVGERVSLDGVLSSEYAMVDTSALTGESIPREITKGEKVLAGSIAIARPFDIKVSDPYTESTLAKLLKLIEDSGRYKSSTESFIRRFAKVYTPIVAILSVLIVLVPFLYSIFDHGWEYDFHTWFYRGLVFLVTSCPCALVIGIPLAYFAGIGKASKEGLLIKGSTYLDKLRGITTFGLDKTGTVTQGRFEVTSELTRTPGDDTIYPLLVAVERYSTHPIAQAVCRYFAYDEVPQLLEVREDMGLGLMASTSDGLSIVVGSPRMLEKHGIDLPPQVKLQDHTTVIIAVDGEWRAVVTLSDIVKDTAVEAISSLRHRGIRQVIILSGDKSDIVRRVSREVGADEGIGDLLPQEKVEEVQRLLSTGKLVAFVGDGLNDAPVMAMSDISFGMGGIGSDAAIEAADVIIQSDDLKKLSVGIDISRFTHTILLQNILFALTTKGIIMLLTLLGYASLTLAILADVGVCLLVVLNAMRILRLRV